jgi:hypothetical protein
VRSLQRTSKIGLAHIQGKVQRETYPQVLVCDLRLRCFSGRLYYKMGQSRAGHSSMGEAVAGTQAALLFSEQFSNLLDDHRVQPTV